MSSILDGLSEDWQKVNRKDKTSGMSKKAVKAYRRENPGSKLQTAVTTKPSKLKKGSKDAKRRKSFCARMGGMKKKLTGAKTKNDPNSRINKALRRWNCESVEQLTDLYLIMEQQVNTLKEFDNIDENLHKWFKEKWVRFNPQGKIMGPCARDDDSEGKPKCLPQSKAHSLGKEGRASAAARKRREDPNPERSGKAINVATKKKANEEIDETWSEKYKRSIDCNHPRGFSQKAHCAGRKKNESLEEEQLDEKCWDTHKQVGMKKKGNRMVPNCVPKESIEENIAQNIQKGLSALANTTRNGVLHRAAILAMQGRQSEGYSILQNVIKDSSPNVQKHVMDQYKSIKPVMVNNRVADSSTLEKSKPHQDWIYNTWIPWVDKQLGNQVTEEKDACYNKVKSRYKVWPSAYASGALVKCRKVGANNWGNKSKSTKESVDTQVTKLPESQIYSGGNKPAGLKYYKPRKVPNQHELSRKESVIMKGLQVENDDKEFHTGGGKGLPKPGTYEQETLPYRTKGQRRTQAIAFENKINEYSDERLKKYKQEAQKDMARQAAMAKLARINQDEKEAERHERKGRHREEGLNKVIRK